MFAVLEYSATLVLASFVAVGVIAGLLYQSGILGLILRLVFGLAERCIRGGYRLWDTYLSSLSWEGMAGILVGLHVLRWPFNFPPLVTALLGAILLTAGAITVLAYMFIDTERYEVSRGYKALHNPVKGQRLAEGLARHGERVGFMLLVLAIISCISGFSLMNLGLSESIGQNWYEFGEHPSREKPSLLSQLVYGKEGFKSDSYADFLAYTLINLAYLVDLIDLANKTGGVGIGFVRPSAWPATALLVSFRLFFSFVLLQQLVSLVRHGRLLGESVQDLWSPYEPIQRRAAEHLKRQGPDAVAVVLAAIETVAPLTAEQRTMLPQVLAEIGPAAVPLLSRSLDHPSADVRAVSLATLGHLQAWWALPELNSATDDAAADVRLALAGALEDIASLGPNAMRKQWSLGRSSLPRRRWLRLMGRAEKKSSRNGNDPVELCVVPLRTLLRDENREVRIRAASAIQALGTEAASAVGELFEMAREEDDGLQAAAAEALGQIGGPPHETITALLGLLTPPAPLVLVSAIRSLGKLGHEAAYAVPSIIPFLQHENEEIRKAAAEAIGDIGQLDASAAPQLVEDLSSRDDQVRARAAEALGTIGPPAAMTAPALVHTLSDASDYVRSKAAIALGLLGPDAANESVPALSRALDDTDSHVAARAAEALGMLEGAAAAADRELRRALEHINPDVRRHAANALGQIGLEPEDVAPLMRLFEDEEGQVRRQVVLTLGGLETPGPPVMQALVKAIDDKEPSVRAAAVEVLGKPNADRKIVIRLTECLKDGAAEVQVAAARALGDLKEPTPGVVEALAEALNGSAEEVRAAAAAALGQLGEYSLPVADRLREMVKGESLQLREHTLRALVQIQPPNVMDVFLAALLDPEPVIRRLASAGLMKQKEMPLGSWTTLIDALRDPDPQVCANIAHVCSKQESLPAEVVPVLLSHTTSPDDGLRLNALRALRSVPVAGGDLVLASMLEDTNLQIALQASAVLICRDPKTPGLEIVLARALKAGVMFRDQAFKAIESANGDLPGLRPLLERLWEQVNDAPVRDHLQRLLTKISEATEAT